MILRELCFQAMHPCKRDRSLATNRLCEPVSEHEHSNILTMVFKKVAIDPCPAAVLRLLLFEGIHLLQSVDDVLGLKSIRQHDGEYLVGTVTAEKNSMSRKARGLRDLGIDQCVEPGRRFFPVRGGCQSIQDAGRSVHSRFADQPDHCVRGLCRNRYSGYHGEYRLHRRWFCGHLPSGGCWDRD